MTNSTSYYPLILKAPLKDYIWGGTRLKSDFGFESDLEKVAEAWVVSCHKDGPSVVSNGPLSGKTLEEAIEILGADALGEACKDFDRFPILVKLIDAKDRLSIQVHPSDEYARANEGDNGKTEMWYVIDCDEGAQLVYGFKHSIDSTEFRERIESNTLGEVLNYVDVHKGDMFYIPSGTVHAIGKGILIAEIQQNSNVTYRVSDYGRLGADGKPRQLHVEKAIAVSNTNPPLDLYGNVGKITTYDNATVRSLAKCKYFDAKLINLEGSLEIHNIQSFVSLVVIDGEAALESEQGSYTLKKGESVFVPCGIEFILNGTAQILSASV
ncbi:MAG: class I mannose-6-phosphate isomerase [Oscillospiraceae bacterium]|nr:class I mannose-6-phosphate isomerase [Oscillospiraceae bacterium]